jgi:hypothetical protein
MPSFASSMLFAPTFCNSLESSWICNHLEDDFTEMWAVALSSCPIGRRRDGAANSRHITLLATAAEQREQEVIDLMHYK